MRSGGLGYENCIQTVYMLLLCALCGDVYVVCVGCDGVCRGRRSGTWRTGTCRGTQRFRTADIRLYGRGSGHRAGDDMSAGG